MSDCPAWVLDKPGLEKGVWDYVLEKLNVANPFSEEEGGHPDLILCACETYKSLQIAHQCLTGAAKEHGEGLSEAEERDAIRFIEDLISEDAAPIAFLVEYVRHGGQS